MTFIPGDTVVVYNQKMSGEPIIEGRAVVVKPAGVADQYKVRFPPDRGSKSGTVFTRFVYPGECQTDPDAYLAKAKAEWRRGWANPNDPNISLSEGVSRAMAGLGL